MNPLTRVRRWWWGRWAAAIDRRYRYIDVTCLPPLVSTDEAVRVIRDAVRRINDQAAADAAEREGR